MYTYADFLEDLGSAFFSMDAVRENTDTQQQKTETSFEEFLREKIRFYRIEDNKLAVVIPGLVEDELKVLYDKSSGRLSLKGSIFLTKPLVFEATYPLKLRNLEITNLSYKSGILMLNFKSLENETVKEYKL